MLGGAILIIVLTGALAYFLVTRSEPSKSRPARRHAPHGDARSIEARIDEMELRAAELEQQLAALDDDESEQDDPTLRDWTANGSGPSFEIGAADIPLAINYCDAKGRTSSR